MIQGLYKIFDHWHARGTVWICSDPHFDDPEMVHLTPDKPSSEELVKLINSKVGRHDTIIFLGDIGNIEWIRKIRGYKILVMGNHDAGASNYKREVIATVHDANKISKEELEVFIELAYPSHSYSIESGLAGWVVVRDNKLFDEVYEGPLMIGEKLILSHEPVDVPWAFNIHGHDHSGWHGDDDHHLNVCLDRNKWIPLNFNRLMKNGIASKVESIHRETIDRATKRSRKRKSKNG